jgi:dihydroxy-acid dehydratase
MAKVFDSEQAAMAAIRDGSVIAGDVIVVRHVGPIGAPGMPEMVHLTIQLQGRGLGKEVALITDGRFSGVSHGILVGHICPEGAKGGPIGVVRDGDTIVINPKTRRLDLDITPDEMVARMAQLGTPELSDVPEGSVLGKYRRLVSSAHYGCVL